MRISDWSSDVCSSDLTLTADVLEASGRDDIVLTVDAPDGLTLEPDIAVSMALIVTEAVNNAIEHGLPHRGGSIHVGLDISDGTIKLDITDDGKGLPANFDPGFGPSSEERRVGKEGVCTCKNR